MKNNYPNLFLFLAFLIICSCATYKEQIATPSVPIPGKKAVHTFYMIGGYGNNPAEAAKNLDALNHVIQSDPNSTLLFLGDNIDKKGREASEDEKNLVNQFRVTGDYKGMTFFIPGDYDWKYDNSALNENQEDFLRKATGNKKIFLPSNGCPLDSYSVNENLELIFVDSEWYMANWDNVKYINKKCTGIETRRRFIEELESLISDAKFKNIVIVMHHPVFSNGEHAGNFSFKDYMSPFPIAGTIDKSLRKLGGVNSQDFSYKEYRDLVSSVTSLAKLSDRITIVSGHEESLQYLEGGGLHQIISGSLSSTKETRLSKNSISTVGGRLDYNGIYANGQQGYAKLLYFGDGSSSVEFHSFNTEKLLYSHTVLTALAQPGTIKPGKKVFSFDKTYKKAILPKEDTDKSGLYKLFWGDHYRNYYSMPVTAQTAILDTLYGGLTITKEGGGHQSQSLRLKGSGDRQFAMRSLKKNALKFLRFKIKGMAYDPDSYKGTAAEKIVADFFTTAHPYVQLAVSDLAKAAGINYSKTKLYYFPKQDAFGDLNDEYGNALYFVEERPSKGQLAFEGYQFTQLPKQGEIKDFIGTTEMLEKLRKDDKYSIDQKQYIRSRIFDMLVGDWDRHEDQWRWAEREISGKIVFVPIPRDRDAAFSKFDGLNLKLIRLVVPETRFWQTYSDEVNDVKWFNSEAYNLDKVLLNTYDKQVWEEEAKSIQQQLSEQTINDAFLNLPLEMRDKSIDDIKEILKARLANLSDSAVDYANFMNKKIIIPGTDGKDKFIITRMPDGETKIEMFDIAKGSSVYQRTFSKDVTSEVLLYGLNDDDEFIVNGKADSPLVVRIIGGYGNDSYAIEDCRKIRVYDFDYEQNVFSGKAVNKQLSSLYETNNFHYRFFKPNSNVLLPVFGFATDDGLFLGLKDKYTYNGFNGNPAKQVHAVFANYYFDYNAIEAGYSGVFSNVFPNFDFFAEAYISTSHFSNNFFGYGNETVNDDKTLGKDYYRARTRQFSVKSGLIYKKLSFAAVYESFEVEQDESRFFNSSNLNENVFKNQDFIGAEATISYENNDASDFPTLGLYASATAGWKSNMQNGDNNFGYVSGKLGFNRKLVSGGSLVFQTTIGGRTIFGDNFNFYHSSFMGGNSGLRGYRNERFSGKSSLYDSSNLKLRLSRLRTSFLPVDFGIYGGYDIGRVWIEYENSNKWHTSQGGGLWFGALDMLSLQAGLFNSEEGNILVIGFNFKY